MQSDDLILPIFFGFVALAMALSLFLWFAKGKRTGVLLWSAYAVRALGGLSIFISAMYAAEVLSEAADFWSVAVFVGPMGLIGLVLAAPWGLLAASWTRSGVKGSLA